MQYLSSIGSAMMRLFVKNDLSREEWIKIRDERQGTTLADFTARLDRQMRDIEMYMDMVSEEDLHTKEVELPSKEKMLLGTAIINAPIKWMATYRMQIFMYLKINSGHNISTREAWTIIKD